MKQRFRVNDYDAPETWRPKSEAEKVHGLTATARAEELLLGKDITIRSTKMPGVYGRFGADVWLEDGRFYTDVMFQEGLEKLDEY
jgi:endonuclease YncB( thermonuclease family)